MSTPPQIMVRPDPRGKAGAILVAAARAFLARGFGAVSMDAIARDAGVSKATVYAHFAGKEELFGAIVADLTERRFGGFSVEVLDPDDITGSLTTIAARFLDLVLSPEAIALNRILIGEVSRFPALGQVFWAAGPEHSRAQIEAFLRRAAAAGALALPDPRLAAEQFVALVRGEVHLRSLLKLEKPGDPVVLNQAAANAVATFLRAFGPSRQTSTFVGPAPSGRTNASG